jgi:hypothetical protein
MRALYAHGSGVGDTGEEDLREGELGERRSPAARPRRGLRNDLDYKTVSF